VCGIGAYIGGSVAPCLGLKPNAFICHLNVVGGGGPPCFEPKSKALICQLT
jgi:hypothetical protein